MPLELQLARLRRRLTVWVCARGLERLAWLAAVLVASDYAIDRLLRLGLGVRIGLFLGLAIVAAVAATRWLLIPFWRRPTDAALCGEIERRVPEARGLLTAVYELSRSSPGEVSGLTGPTGVSRASGTSRALNRETLGSPELIAELRRQVEDVCSRHDFADLVAPIADARRRLRLAAAALVWIVGFVAVHHTREGTIWLRRNVLWKSVAWPQRTYLEVEGLKDGKLRIARGSGTTVDVLVGAKSSEIPAAVQVDFRPAAARPAQAVRRAGDRRFQIGWRNVLDSFQFRVRGGDEVTEWLPVELVTPATVQQLEVTAEPPAYIGSAAIELTSGLTAQPIPHGSRLLVRGRASRPLKSATLVQGERRSELTTGLKGEFRGSVEPTMLTSGRYQLELRDEDGFDIAPPVAFQLDVVADQPPVVRGRWVGASRLVTPRAQVRFHAAVEDDHELASAEATVAQQLSDVGATSGTAATSSSPTAAASTAAAATTSSPAMAAGSSTPSKPALSKTTPGKPSAMSSDAQSASIVVARREFDTATRSADWSELLDLEPLKIPIGSIVTLRVAALDRDDVAGPNRGEGAELLVRVVAEDELRSDLLRREKEQRQQLTQQLDDAETIGERLTALVSSMPDADPTIDRVERLLEASSGVRAIAAALDSSTLVLQQVVDESVHNRIEPTNGPIASRLGQRVLPVLRQLAGPDAAAIVEQLERAARARTESTSPASTSPASTPTETTSPDALAEATKSVAQFVARLRVVVQNLSQAEGFQEAINLVTELQAQQGDVAARTDAAQRVRVDRLLGGDKRDEAGKRDEAKDEKDSKEPKESKELADASSSEAEELQRRQLRVVRRHEEMEQRFRELATALSNDEPEQAERITKALALSKELLLRNRLEQAAEALRGVRWEPGATGHREIARDLQRLRAVLLSRDTGGADGPSAAEQLAARLAEILSRQQPLTVSTRELLKRRPAAGDWKRADRLQLGRVASEEKALSSAAEAAAEAIADEPGGDVVASMVSEIQTNLAQLSESVGKLAIDEGLVARQREVEQTLAELIRSLEPRGGPEAEPSAPSDAPKPDGDDGKPPLLAGAGQWKLLRSIQERIVQRTRAIEGLRRDGPLDAAAQAELKELARRQDELRKLVQRALGEVE